MFHGEDRQALKILVDNNTITQDIQKTLKFTLDTIQTTIKADEHFWCYCNKLVSDLWQKPYEATQPLNNHIIQLINSCKFSQ